MFVFSLALGVFVFVLSVSFLVLVERYVLRRSQSRVGCRTTGYYGLLQTLVDGRKLFLKSEGLGSLFCGLVFFTLALLVISFSNLFLLLLVFLGLMGLTLLAVTLSSSNSFALVSFIRVVLIRISFDVVMCFFILARVFLLSRANFSIFIVFMSVSLMELGRTPFDLLEGESELVSRYNVEYGGFGFTLLFLGEYCGFFWIGCLFNFLFVLGSFYGFVLFRALISVRAVLPRLKFSQVLKLSWGSLNLFIFVFLVFC